ncbi:MAG TPA: zinc-binding dehydrogenase [Roseiarcus sp.]|nr:zinc-binding dehydrogenase [Roseiarcus sp.]
MVDIRRSTIVNAPLDEVWAILRDFNGHERWHPSVTSSVIEDDADADRIGAVRNFRLSDGGRIREQLLALSDVAKSFSYCILEAPVSLRNYVAHVRLRAVTENDTCLWQWSASFDPLPAERERLTRFVAQDIMAAGFRAVSGLLVGETGASSPPADAPKALSAPSGLEATAIILTRYGGPDALVAQKILVASPGPGEARIRQTAIGVNFIDVYCRRGSFQIVAPPGIIGMEAAGVVESVGPGVTNVKPGDRVGYACAPPGSYTSIRTMRTDLLVQLPALLTDNAAASMLLKGITAGFLLHDVYAVRPGDVVVVHAAAGGVGQLLCRWAKALGATVIGATSSDAKAEQAKRVGCDHVIITTRQDIAEAVMRLTDERGAEVVYDAVGRDTFEASINCLSPRGHLVSFGQASGDVGAYSIDKLANRSVTLSRPNYVHYTDTPSKLKQQAERLFGALESGILVAERPRPYALANVCDAHADLESRKTTGALVLIP